MKSSLFFTGNFLRLITAAVLLWAGNLQAAPDIVEIAGQSVTSGTASVTVPCGKALVVPVSATGTGPLSFTVSSSNPKILPIVKTGNPYLKIHVDYAGDGGTSLPFSGDLIFQLFRDLTPKTAGLIGGFAQAGFYDGLIFHRVTNIAPGQSGSSGFIIQGGDPLGTGLGGPGMSGTDTSTIYKFDNELSAPLIFDGKGQLAMANSDGTANYFGSNGSQFFITEGTLRFLDFNHTIFGQLVRGFDVLDKIRDVPTNGSGKPNVDVRMSTASLVEDTTDAVLIVSAVGVTDATPASVTVTATDSLGASTSKIFEVNAVTDTVNDPPILHMEAPGVSSPIKQRAHVRFSVEDLEFDPISPGVVFGTHPNGLQYILSNTEVTLLPAAASPVGAVLLGVSVQQFDSVLRTDPADRGVSFSGLANGTLKALETFVQAAPAVPISNAVVATISDAEVHDSPSDFTVSINWGDGTPLTSGSNVSVVRAQRPAPSAFNVIASHTYTRAGIYPLTVTIDDVEGTRVVAANTAIVTNSTLVAMGRTFRTTTGAISNAALATFSDSAANPNDYTASIDWGDGSFSRGIVRTAKTGFRVGGAHRYAHNGVHSISVKITKTSTAETAAAWISVSVTGAPRKLPPFPQVHIYGQFGTITKTPPSSLSPQIRVGNSGNKTSGPILVYFYLSDDATLDKPGDTPLKVGTQSALRVSPLKPDTNMTGVIQNVVYPAGAVTTGKYLLMEVSYSDPIGDFEPSRRVFAVGPLQ